MPIHQGTFIIDIINNKLINISGQEFLFEVMDLEKSKFKMEELENEENCKRFKKNIEIPMCL